MDSVGAMTSFPIMEKYYKTAISEEIHKGLRTLGKHRARELLGLNSRQHKMKFLKNRAGVDVHAYHDKEFFTMKGTVTMQSSLLETLEVLNTQTNLEFRNLMESIYGHLFLDGVVLYDGKSRRRSEFESIRVKWMAYLASKPHLPHRDYVFLEYGNIYEHSGGSHGSVESSTSSSLGSNGMTGVHVWESVELDGCEPFPTTNFVVRLKLRRSGFVIEETPSEDTIRVSFFLSESMKGKKAVSILSEQWMEKMVRSLNRLEKCVESERIAKQVNDDNVEADETNYCSICMKSFNMFRRKHHCRICGESLCAKCSIIKEISKNSGSLKKSQVRICAGCTSSSLSQIKKSSSSIASSDTSSNYDEISSYSGSVRHPSFQSELSKHSFDLEDEECNLEEEMSHLNTNGGKSSYASTISSTSSISERGPTDFNLDSDVVVPHVKDHTRLKKNSRKNDMISLSNSTNADMILLDLNSGVEVNI